MSFMWRIALIRRGEATITLLAAAQFYLILTSFMVLRPARESMGLESGIETVRWLFMGTLVATLAAHPIFAWVVSRFARRVFVPLTYRFFSLNLVAFWAIITFWPDAVGIVMGRLFYIWLSVFNLAAVSLFWALLADGMKLQQAKRLFAPVAAGGTVGAITGSTISSQFATIVGTAGLLLVAAVLLEVCAWVVMLLGRTLDAQENKTLSMQPLALSNAIIGGDAWSGMRQVVRSPYLISICLYVVLMAVVATFLYFTQLRLVDALDLDRDDNTRIFANIDLWTQIATLTLQAVVAGHLMRRVGVGVALATLPVITAGGIVALAIMPTLALLVVVQAMVRAVQRAVARPARETLFAVLSREDEYKAKSFIDTFMFRGGDVVGAQVERPLYALAPGLMGLAVAIVPIAIAWTSISIYLGARQRTLAKSDSHETETIAAGSTTGIQGAGA
jgi:ATP:ADP antiporter, AAA family